MDETKIGLDYEREYHKVNSELMKLELDIVDMIEQIFIQGLNEDTRKKMIEVMRKCR